MLPESKSENPTLVQQSRGKLRQEMERAAILRFSKWVWCL